MYPSFLSDRKTYKQLFASRSFPLTGDENLRSFCNVAPNRVRLVVYHLPRIPGNSGWDVNDKRFFGSSHWKIPGTNENSEKVVLFSRLGRSEWKFVHHLQVFFEFRTSFML